MPCNQPPFIPFYCTPFRCITRTCDPRLTQRDNIINMYIYVENVLVQRVRIIRAIGNIKAYKGNRTIALFIESAMRKVARL